MESAVSTVCLMRCKLVAEKGIRCHYNYRNFVYWGQIFLLYIYIYFCGLKQHRNASHT